jgi:serine/threonine protein kinase
MLKYVISEKNVMSKTNHPFIIKLNYTFQTHSRLFLVLDFCPNGDLCSHINMEEKMDEEKCRFYAACILLAIEDLHKRNIIFRDLKPDNVLIDEAGFAMLTDFGLAKETETQDLNKSFCGSFAYLAPEIIMQTGHCKSVDWYLFGTMIYEMLTGLPPYYEKNRKNIIQNILRAPLRIPMELSEEAKSIIVKVNPSCRHNFYFK